MRGIRHFLRQYTAQAVKEHIRSQVDASAPRLTTNEAELVRFIRDGRFNWDAYFAGRS